MPKFSWGISAETIDNAETNERSAYDGPTPPKGVYGWNVKFIKTGKTSNGNPNLIVGLELNPRGREEHQQYGGFFVQDFIVVLPQTAFRVKPFLGALGVSSKEFETDTVVDEEGMVTKIGRLDLTRSVRPVVVAMLQVNRGQKASEYPREIGQYLPKITGSVAPPPGGAGFGVADDEAPF